MDMTLPPEPSDAQTILELFQMKADDSVKSEIINASVNKGMVVE